VPNEKLKLPSKRVVVIGGGIAGLTAAQELAERGYEVQVVETAQDPYTANQPRLGGMARTAWARVPQPSQQAPLLANAARPAAASSEAASGASNPWEKKALKADNVPAPVILTFVGSKAPSGDTTSALHIVKFCEEDPTRTLSLIAVKSNIYRDASCPLGALGPDPGSQDPVAESMKSWIQGNVKAAPYSLSVLDYDDTDRGYLQIGIQSARVPGEHGFRFFPSFYRHMFDTAQRIPIPEVSLDNPIIFGSVPQADSARSVFDNLVSGTSLELAFAPNPTAKVKQDRTRAFSVPRTPVMSKEVSRRMQANALEKAGYRGLDVVRLMTKYLEYMTSSPERRREQYERQSWADFMGLPDGYSPYFAGQVNGGAQALVAMSTKTNDARTIGTPAVQLILDEIRTGPRTDGILNGPTTTALFAPWQDYLQTLGVRFTVGTLSGFTAEGMAVSPFFQVGEEAPPIDPADYYVITIPVVDFQALFPEPTPEGLAGRKELLDANRLCLQLEPLPEGMSEGEDPDDVRKYLEFRVNDYVSHPDQGPFRYMCGIQFFFGRDVSLIGGHSICPDSPWGVCYLSQVQYWQDRQRGANGVRGVVSATFTQFEVEATGSDGVAKTAFDCTEAEIADRVWAQIKEAWDVSTHGPLPVPEYFYVDENLKRCEGRWMNRTPYLVNDIETWPERGGVRTDDDDYRYILQFGHTVFAGVFMRTWTRMNTMEAANETGRRAANAILAHEDANATPCPLWNMENNEVPELLALRDLDRRVLARGGKHPMRSTAFEMLLRATPWDLMRLGLPTYPDPSND
jgi:FAD dependent oxidoreductase